MYKLCIANMTINKERKKSVKGLQLFKNLLSLSPFGMMLIMARL